jgi:hypothetical protein
MRSSIIFILMLLQSQSLTAQTFNRGCEDSQVSESRFRHEGEGT